MKSPEIEEARLGDDFNVPIVTFGEVTGSRPSVRRGRQPKPRYATNCRIKRANLTFYLVVNW